MLKKKLLISVAALSMVVGAGAGAYATSHLETIQAFLNHELKVKVNGVQAQLNDEQGNAVLPITYEGNTYLPVRAIAGALGVAVDYDAATTTVLLGEKVEGVSIAAEKYSDTYVTDDKAHTTYQNKDYRTVYYNKATSASSSGNGSIMLYPDKKYQTLQLQVGAIDAEVKVSIYESGTLKLLKEAVVVVESGMTTVEADIGGISELYIELASTGGGFVVPLTTSAYK